MSKGHKTVTLCRRAAHSAEALLRRRKSLMPCLETGRERSFFLDAGERRRNGLPDFWISGPTVSDRMGSLLLRSGVVHFLLKTTPASDRDIYRWKQERVLKPISPNIGTERR